jgi:hypothetical protein
MMAKRQVELENSARTARAHPSTINNPALTVLPEAFHSVQSLRTLIWESIWSHALISDALFSTNENKALALTAT